jgi:hypothetical protein
MFHPRRAPLLQESPGQSNCPQDKQSSARTKLPHLHAHIVDKTAMLPMAHHTVIHQSFEKLFCFHGTTLPCNAASLNALDAVFLNRNPLTGEKTFPPLWSASLWDLRKREVYCASGSVALFKHAAGIQA